MAVRSQKTIEFAIEIALYVTCYIHGAYHSKACGQYFESMYDEKRLADGIFAQPIELFVNLLQRASSIDTKENDGVASTLGVQACHTRSRKRPIGLAHAQSHSEGDLQHLVARRMTLSSKNLVAKGLVKVGHTHHTHAFEVLFLQQLLKIVGKGDVWQLMAAEKRIDRRSIQQLMQKLFRQTFALPLPLLS